MSRETLSATSPTVSVLLRIPADERATARRLARKERVTAAEWIRVAIRERVARVNKSARNA